MTIHFLDPKTVGLSSRDRIVENSNGGLALIINRKSRIVMADGMRILNKARKIRDCQPGVSISVRTTAPICGKTRTFLNEHDISIESTD